VRQSRHPASDEAKWRTAVSRAYYAAFCEARGYLTRVEGLAVPEGPEAHQFVIDVFANKSSTGLRRISSRLDGLRDDRNKADYDDWVSGLQSKSTASTRTAWRIISALPRP
jgi:uncharacterized protein (UPF0332 family)